MKKQNAGAVQKKQLSEQLTKSFAEDDQTQFLAILTQLASAYGLMNLSRDTGINRVSIWKYLKGQTGIRTEALKKILKALGLQLKVTVSPQMTKYPRTIEWYEKFGHAAMLLKQEKDTKSGQQDA